MKRQLILFLIPLSTATIFLFTISGIHYNYTDTTFLRGSKWAVATSIINYKTLGVDGQPTTEDDPLYPIMLALFRMVTGDNIFLAMILQASVFAIGAVYLYKLGALILKSRSTAIIATLLYSFYPYYIGQSVGVLETPLITTLLIMCCYYYQVSRNMKGYIICGLVFGMAMLTRSAIALPFLFFVLLLSLCRKEIKKPLFIALTFVFVVMPFYLRNYNVDGSFTPSRLGNNLHKGNCRYTDQINPVHNFDILVGYHHKLWEQSGLSSATQKEKDDLLLREAVNYMISNPLNILKIKLLNIYYLFYPRLIPYLSTDFTRFKFGEERLTYGSRYWNRRGTAAEIAYTISYTPIFIMALFGLWHRKKYLLNNDLILTLIAVTFILIYCIIFFAGTRYRAPMDFVLMLYAATVLNELLRKYKPITPLLN